MSHALACMVKNKKKTNKALINNAMLNKWNSSLIDIVENAVIIS